MRRIDLDTRYEFSKTAHTKVYWIAAVGTYWHVREEGERRARPLIDWHHSVHRDDAASYTDFQALATLVLALQASGTMYSFSLSHSFILFTVVIVRLTICCTTPAIVREIPLGGLSRDVICRVWMNQRI